MSLSALRNRLLALQPDAELERKARKARTRKYWTAEELDWAARRAERLYAFLNRGSTDNRRALKETDQ